MAHKREKYSFEKSNEYDIKYMGKYGAKGEKRAPRKKATPEQVRKQNQTNRENRMRRLIKENFKEDDLWNTLKFPKGARVTLEQLNKCLKKFLDTCRREYASRGQPFKWIYRKETGRRGGVHVHILTNRLDADTDKVIKSAWKKAGGHSVNFEPLYEQGGYDDLAKYIVKEPDEAVEKQLSLFPEEERKQFRTVSTSRNLSRPEPEVTVYSRRTVRKLIEYGPEPTPGYYIDKNSIVCGINPYTGMSYYRYTEVRIGTSREAPWEKWEGGGA